MLPMSWYLKVTPFSLSRIYEPPLSHVPHVLVFGGLLKLGYIRVCMRMRMQRR